jgi:hypothetical protein
MTPSGGTTSGAFRVLHLEGWTVLRAARDVDLDGMSELLSALAALTGPAVVDLADHVVAEAERERLVASIAGKGTDDQVLLVASRTAERHALVALGAAHVYESLDAAVGVTQAPLIERHGHSGEAQLAAASDVQTVAAHDLLGRSDNPRA